MSSHLNTRIAIIGAGASGLTAALELKRRGYKHVVIFERDDRVGGKTFSYTYKGTAFDIGSMMFSRTDEIVKLADEFKVLYQSFKAKEFYYSKGKYLDPIAYALQEHSLFEIFRSMYGLRSIIKRNKLGEPGFGELDPDLFQSFSSFLRSHHLDAGARIFQPAVTGLGYGFFETTPALYSLKILASMLDTNLVKSLLTNGDHVCFFPSGWMKLWQKIAKTLDVRLNSRIASIRRDKGQGVEITVNRKKEMFDKLIITAPLNHVHEYLDITDKEKKLFAKIQHQRMVSTLVEGTAPLQTVFLADNAVPERMGHVLGTECYAPETNCSVLFQIVPKGMTQKKIRRLLEEDLAEMHCDVKHVVIQREWEYFYHVSSQDLADGFYDKLNALQGKRETYFVSGILNFETVGHSQELARHVVDRYFP